MSALGGKSEVGRAQARTSGQRRIGWNELMPVTSGKSMPGMAYPSRSKGVAVAAWYSRQTCMALTASLSARSLERASVVGQRY